MATVLRGKDKDKKIKINQVYNDWITDWNNKVYNPTSLEYTDKERELISHTKGLGLFFRLYYWDGNRLKHRRNR